MLGKTCRICMHKKAKFSLPSCTHAICNKCWNTLVKNTHTDTIKCPFCRREQNVTIYKFWQTFKNMHILPQALIIFATIKLIYG